MGSFRKSLVLQFAERYSALAVQIVSTLILARLLTPREIGVYSVAAVLVGLAHVMRDFGVGQYIMQERELTAERIRTAFGIAILLGWLIALILFGVSRFAADFYREPGVGEAIGVLVLNFVLLPFTTVQVALWRRDMNFVQPYYIKTAGVIVYAVTAVTLAYAGFGYMSMAWAAVAGVATNVLIASTFCRHSQMQWLPAFTEFRRVFSISGMVSVTVAAKELGTAAPDLIIGRMLGFAEVGLFGRATGLVRMFEQNVSAAVSGVMLPHLSAEHRRGIQVGSMYLRAASMITVAAWPFFALLGLMAYPAIRLLFGPQWEAAAPLLSILCLWGASNALFCFAGYTLIAVGAARANMLLECTVQSVTVALLLVGAVFGLHQIALAVTCSSALAFAVSTNALRRHIGVSLKDMLAATRKSLAVTVLSGCIPLWVRLQMEIGPDSYVLPLALASAGAVAGWLLGVFALAHPARVEILNLLKRGRGLR